MYKIKVTSKGQITIPKELREKMGIDTGTNIVIKETEAGYIIQKQVDNEVLKKYIGILGDNSSDENNSSSDKVIKELRGE